MPETKPQTKANHARFDPGFHFTLVPLLLAMIIWEIIHVVRHPGTDAIVLLILTACVVWAVTKARLYALKVQDRVIRLEERLRLAMLLPDPERGRIGELSEGQLIALRFASDPELPSLFDKALREGLSNKQIKERIQTWRPDYFRV
jgi:hypothetical protein